MTSRRFTWLDLFNGLGAAGALSASVAVTLLGSSAFESSLPSSPTAANASDPRVALPNGQRGLRDASGEIIELRSFERIVSASGLADPLLLELCDPQRIVAFSGRRDGAPDAHRFAGRPTVGGLDRVERMLELKPDLVLINRLGREDHLLALRRAGLVVFDLGPMRGLETLRQSTASLGWLLGHAARSESFMRSFESRLKSVADAIPQSKRLTGLYLGMHANYLSGGTTGSSYHDVLSYAGLLDAAAAEYEGWPSYTPEQLLKLDPDVLVTQVPMAAEICQNEPLSLLRACTRKTGVIEIDGHLIHDAGLGMLPAAEEIFRRVYLERSSARSDGSP